MPQKNEKDEVKVLFVCYDPQVISTEKRCLELQGGLCIETASSNDEALTKVERTVPDVIVGDFTGFLVGAAASASELVRTLRSEGYGTPIIVFSYDDEKDLFAEVLKSGAIGFVEKSGDPSAVYSTLKSRIVHMTHEL